MKLTKSREVAEGQLADHLIDLFGLLRTKSLTPFDRQDIRQEIKLVIKKLSQNNERALTH